MQRELEYYKRKVKQVYEFWQSLPDKKFKGSWPARWGVVPGEVKYMDSESDKNWDIFLRELSIAATACTQAKIKFISEREVLGL